MLSKSGQLTALPKSKVDNDVETPKLSYITGRSLKIISNLQSV